VVGGGAKVVVGAVGGGIVTLWVDVTGVVAGAVVASRVELVLDVELELVVEVVEPAPVVVDSLVLDVELPPVVSRPTDGRSRPASVAGGVPPSLPELVRTKAAAAPTAAIASAAAISNGSAVVRGGVARGCGAITCVCPSSGRGADITCVAPAPPAAAPAVASRPRRRPLRAGRRSL
jgi:hypothetical protein